MPKSIVRFCWYRPPPLATSDSTKHNVAAGTSYLVDISGPNLTPETFFDVRFSIPGSDTYAVVLNWQRGLTVSHGVPAGTAAGSWTINGVRAHEEEADHTGDFTPLNATITVSP